ncbi:hypothetical protein QR680_006199 [Steinernema hermaphroditum]|uniref:Uncharacterized protein n=1 Tax=Steinernema hermaphroditum TaxID=289476 RepID=A0AA39HUM8_9BILA|nr:hypothetical protein QR680_006199 [Steinernema hermaphroditum]
MDGNMTASEWIALTSTINSLNQAETVVMFISIPVNIIIIFLSFTKVAPSLARMYTVNMAIVMLVDVLYSLAFLIISSINSETASHIVPIIIYEFLRLFTLNVYYFQATLTVVLSYIAFARPGLAMHVLKDRHIKTAFAIAYMLSTSTAIAQVLTEFDADSTTTTICNFFRGVAQLLTIGLMAVFYVLALYYIFVTMRQPEAAGQNKPTRRALRAVLIYCTPPNLLLVVACPEIICNCFIDLENSKLLKVCVFSSITATFTQNIRIFITSVCAIIAFRDYRDGIMALLRKCFKCCKKKTSSTVMIISISPTNTK